jgi:hypothetical protein
MADFFHGIEIDPVIGSFRSLGDTSGLPTTAVYLGKTPIYLNGIILKIGG